MLLSLLCLLSSAPLHTNIEEYHRAYYPVATINETLFGRSTMST